MTKPQNLILTIFGASGDLTARKLIPALFNLYLQNLLPDGFLVLGIGRTPLTDSSFRDKIQKDLLKFNNRITNSQTSTFIEKLFYLAMDSSQAADYAKLVKRLKALEKTIQAEENYIYYLSTPPSLYATIAENLAVNGLSSEHHKRGEKKLIIEKPFGNDLLTARTLNEQLLRNFKENQLYRIDHYLGKETVQNLIVTRFSNSIFEPLWNRNFVEYVEITSAESIGIENRGGYYDQAGALRDMLQNHLMQLVGLVAMEPPIVIESNAFRHEMLKVFQALRPIHEQDVEHNVVRGQYTASTIKSENVKAYRQEVGIKKDSRTETFAAMKFYIDNWRWAGVPFFIRTGKRLPTRVTEIVIHFQSTPQKLFSNQEQLRQFQNMLIIRIQPDEGILLKYGMKTPGAGFQVQEVNMDFHYSSLSDVKLPEAYERLLHDCMMGDSTLYSRGDALEASWKFFDPIIKAWQKRADLKVFGYPAGTWGPEAADALMFYHGFAWRYPCKNLSDDGLYCEL
jgi:glucose-6-phosphate 1-dehydrogenase